MKSSAETRIIIALLCLCTLLLAACGDVNPKTESTESTVSAESTAISEDASEESSEEASNAAQTGELLLLYKVNFIHPVMGYTETYEYNEFGQILKITQVSTDGAASTKQYEYNKAGLPVKETRMQNGEIKDTRTLEYSENGLLVKETNSGVLVNNTKTYTYDENNRLSEETTESEGAASKRSYTYNEDGSYSVKVKQSNNEEGVVKYSSGGLVLEESFSSSKLVCTYDDDGRLLKTENFDEFGELKGSEVYTYNNLVAEKVSYSYGERESAKRYYYDEHGNLLKVSSLKEDGGETVFEEREYKLFAVVWRD